MGARLSKTTSPETVVPCPDLPLDMAGLVFCRLPSNDDRLSFAAVCHWWRVGARQERPLPPAMPCINLGHGMYQGLIDSKVRCFPTPKGYRAGASFGRWLFYYDEGSGPCFLRAPFSGAVIEVPTHYHMSSVDLPMEDTWRKMQSTMLIDRGIDIKMVVCSSHLVVALFRIHRQGYLHPVTYLASFRPAQLVWSFVIQRQDHPHPIYAYIDIAFYRGKVFALSCWEQLFCHDFAGETNHQGQQPIIEHVDEARPDMLTNCYLVVSSNEQNLLMVRWRRRSSTADGHRRMDLWVFEAEFGTGRWLEVKDLGDQVLFLSRNCSMAFATSSTEHWGQRFRGGNRVFVLGTEWARSLGQPVSYKRDIPAYVVYDMMSGETSLVSLDGPHYIESGTSGWFFLHE